MTREEAIQWLKRIKECHIREYEYDSRGTLGSKVSALLQINEALDLAISALQAEPKITKVRKDGTLFVTVLDAEKVKKVFVNDLQGFCNTFCEEPKQDDDSDYDSLVPDEYNTEPSDLISRAEAIEAVCGVVMEEFDVAPTRGYDVAEKALTALPSAKAEWIPSDDKP